MRIFKNIIILILILISICIIGCTQDESVGDEIQIRMDTIEKITIVDGRTGDEISLSGDKLYEEVLEHISNGTFETMNTDPEEGWLIAVKITTPNNTYWFYKNGTNRYLYKDPSFFNKLLKIINGYEDIELIKNNLKTNNQ